MGLGGIENDNGGLPGIEHVSQISRAAMNAERAISSYRKGLILPDVWVADRESGYTPTSVGEDGQEMTFERRRQMMTNKNPMFDETGKATEEQYFNAETGESVFDKDIEQERLGASAEENRPGLRIALVKELQLPVTDDMVDASDSPIVIHTPAEDGMDTCIYSSGGDAVYDERSLRTHALEAVNRLGQGGDVIVTMSRATSLTLASWSSLTLGQKILGCQIETDDGRGSEVRFTKVDHETGNTHYASLFVNRTSVRRNEETDELERIEDD